MSFKSKLFVAFFVFSSSLIAFSKQILIAKFLIPADYGIYSKFYIVSTFTLSFGALGLYYGTIYNISTNLDDKGFSLIRAKINLLWGYIYITPVLILVLFILLDLDNFYEYLLLIFFSFSQVLFAISYLELNLKSSLRFAKTLLYKNIFTLFPVIVVAYYFNNLYYAIICESVLIIVQLFYLKQFNYKFCLVPFKEILGLFIETKTYLTSVFTASLLFFFVRFIASNNLSSNDLGIYFLGFSLVIIGNQFQYLFSVILNPIFSRRSRANDFGMSYILLTWLKTFLISLAVYFTLYNLKDLVFEFFPKYQQIGIIYLPFCCLGLAKMTEILSIYFILDAKVRFNFRSNMFCILGILIYYIFHTNDLNSLESFINLIYLESILIILGPIIFYVISESRTNRTAQIEQG